MEVGRPVRKGNNREDEVGVLCESEVSGGSNNVRNMTLRARWWAFRRQRTQRTLQCELERLEPHTRKLARVTACEVSILFAQCGLIKSSRNLDCTSGASQNLHMGHADLLCRSNFDAPHQSLQAA